MARLGTRLGAGLAASVVALSLLSLVAPGSAGAVAVEHGRLLPSIPEGYDLDHSLALADGTVYAGLKSNADVYAPTVLYRVAADGTGAWTEVVDPDTGAGLTSPLVDVDGAAVLVSGPQLSSTPCRDFRLIDHGVARQIESCSTPVLGHGSGYVAREDDTGAWRVETQGVTFAPSFATRPALEGSHAWTDALGKVTGVDLVTDEALPGGSIPGGCTPGGFGGVRDGYALLPCLSEARSAVLDVAGSLPPWPLLGTGWGLGTGFAYQLTTVDGVPVVHVVDLGQGKSERWFERSSGLVAVDHGSAAQAVYQVAARSLEIADVGPLAPRSTASEDVVPPSVNVTGPPALVRGSGDDGTRLDWSWRGTDPDHGDALTYEQRTTSYAPGEQPVWQYSAQGYAFTSNFTLARSSQFTCLEVRARDWAGNVSSWVGTPCTYVDGYAPSISITSAVAPPAPPTPPDQLTSTPVVVRYSATDDDQVASYDIASKVALPGQPWSPWTSQSTAATAISRQVPAGAEECYRARARDRAGNIGEDLNEWCVSMPYDDRALQARGDARRVTRTSALGRTATRLSGTRATLRRPGIAARVVWVRVLGHPTACPMVSIGGKWVHRSWCNQFMDGHDTWMQIVARTELTGTLKVRANPSWGPIKVDAIAVGR